MRCYIHEFQDALGNCESCGQPICNDCAERRDGKIYCPNCTGSGWLESEPTPSTSGSERQYPAALVDTKSRIGLFIVGGIGALLGIVGYSLNLFIPFLGYAIMDALALLVISFVGAIFSYLASVLIAIGFYGFYVNYENKMGLIAALLQIVSLLFGIFYLAMLGPVLYGLNTTGFEMQQGDLFSLLFILLLASLIPMITSLVMAISLYQVKDIIGNSNLAGITALLLLSALFLGIIGALVSAVAYMLLAILFSQAEIPETDGWLSKSKSDHTW